MTNLDEIRARLEAISDELGDVAMSLLREAIGDPDRRLAAAAEEKRIQRARRAVDKAAAILGSNQLDV